ncbi:hypothetical protein D6C98_02647 [Aureobasidium pullulans]|nr:hypothetical protein D6C98_02647 [Aureobasidium pullulans]
MVRRPAERDMSRQPVTNGHAYTLIFLLLYPNHHHTVSSRHTYLRSSSRTPGVRSAGNLLQAQHSKTHHLCKGKPMRGLALITAILSNEHQHVVTRACQQSVAGRVVQKELLVSGPQTENANHQRSELTQHATDWQSNLIPICFTVIANLLSVSLSNTFLLPNSNIQLLRNTTFSRFHGIVKLPSISLYRIAITAYFKSVRACVK